MTKSKHGRLFETSKAKLKPVLYESVEHFQKSSCLHKRFLNSLKDSISRKAKVDAEKFIGISILGFGDPYCQDSWQVFVEPSEIILCLTHIHFYESLFYIHGLFPELKKDHEIPAQTQEKLVAMVYCFVRYQCEAFGVQKIKEIEKGVITLNILELTHVMQQLPSDINTKQQLTKIRNLMLKLLSEMDPTELQRKQTTEKTFKIQFLATIRSQLLLGKNPKDAVTMAIRTYFKNLEIIFSGFSSRTKAEVARLVGGKVVLQEIIEAVHVSSMGKPRGLPF